MVGLYNEVLMKAIYVFRIYQDLLYFCFEVAILNWRTYQLIMYINYSPAGSFREVTTAFSGLRETKDTTRQQSRYCFCSAYVYFSVNISFYFRAILASESCISEKK